MHLILDHPLKLVIPKGQTLSLHAREAALLQVRTGRLWLTEDGHRRDHFLSAGQAHRVAAGVRAVIEGDSVEPARADVGAADIEQPPLATVPAGWLARWRAERRRRDEERSLLALDARTLSDIGAPYELIEAARRADGTSMRWRS